MTSTLRPATLSTRGMVAAPHYLASLAGVQVLQEGGNAIDAAIAANAVVQVVWPHMCGLGGDLFAIVHDATTGRAYGYNGSGRAPAATSWSVLREQGHAQMPRKGGHSVTVPGAVDGWFALSTRFGSLPMERLLRPAISYARDGFPISPTLAQAIASGRRWLEASKAASAIFLPRGRPLEAGEVLVQADLARAYERIAAGGREAFYAGELAEAVAATVQADGGLLSVDDLAEHRGDWVEPIRTTFHDVEVVELPPNCQGIAVLELLNIIEPFDLAGMGHNSADAIHLMVEAKKLAFADRDRYVTDPTFVSVPVEALRSKDFAARRRALIDPRRAAGEVSWAPLGAGDTMYLCAADRDGNLVSLIQSLYNPFGSELMVPGWGITLQNRGWGFSLDPQHVNRLEGRKRTRHTLTPAMAYRGGKPWLAFGTRGADGQPQTQVQLVVNQVVHGMDPQQAVEAPRWVSGGPAASYAPDALLLEARIPAEVGQALRARGHNVFVGKQVDPDMGTAQVIRVDSARGLLVGGADPRGDSLALGY